MSVQPVSGACLVRAAGGTIRHSKGREHAHTFPGICGSEAQLVRAHANDFAIALVERMRVKWSLAGKAGVHARKRRRAAEQGSWEAAQRVEEEVVEDAPGEPGQL